MPFGVDEIIWTLCTLPAESIMARIEIAVTLCEPAGVTLRGRVGVTRWVGTGGVTTPRGMAVEAAPDGSDAGIGEGCGEDAAEGGAEGAGTAL